MIKVYSVQFTMYNCIFLLKTCISIDFDYTELNECVYTHIYMRHMTNDIPLSVSKDGFTKWRDSHTALLLDLMSSGQSEYSFCSEIGVDLSTFRSWLKKRPEFKEAYTLGKIKRRQHFEARYLDAMDNPSANIQAIAAASKVVAGMSTSRSSKLKGYKKNGTFQEKYECVFDNLTAGRIDPVEAKAYAEVIKVGLSIEEQTEIKKELREIKEIMAANGNTR